MWKDRKETNEKEGRQNRWTIKEKGREFYKLENTATRDVSNLLETENEEENKTRRKRNCYNSEMKELSKMKTDIGN